jgi:lipopolysaccharide transport system permease protein
MNILSAFLKSVVRFVREMAGTVVLSWRLFVRSIGAKYRNAFLGYFWMLLPAVLITGGVSLAGHAGRINPGNTKLPYPLFVFLGTVIWQVFAEALEVPYQAFEGARSYITRVYFSREAVILVRLYEALIGALLRLVIVLALIAIFVGLSAKGAALIALCFAGAVLLGIGLGAILAPFMLLIADLYNTVKLVLTYGLFLTPALYMPRGDDIFSWVIRWNPISPLMMNAREAAVTGALSSAVGLGITLAAGLALVVVGMTLIRISAPIVIERMLLGGR